MRNSIFLLLSLFLIGIYSCQGPAKSTEDSSHLDSLKRDEFIRDSTEKAQVRAQIVQDSIEDSQIKGYSVKRLSGKHKYGGKTTIEYESLNQILAELEKDSKKEMWTPREKRDNIKNHKEWYPGGRIRLNIERLTIGSANTEWFTIVLKDTAEKEVYRVKLGDDTPEVPSYGSDYWWNIAHIGIEKRIRAPFFVYVIERGKDEPFKFEVTPIKK
jgi:hypothetical protein